MVNKQADYDPKLKKALMEIRKVCQKYDVGGSIFLASQTHAEFGFSNPSWTCMTFNEETSEIRVRAKSGVTRKGALDETVHFLLSSRDVAMSYIRTINQLETRLQEFVVIEHKNQAEPRTNG